MTSSTSPSSSSPSPPDTALTSQFPSSSPVVKPLPDTPLSPSSSAPLPPSPSLLSALISQVNFYFSPHNLLTDAFLLSHMDPHHHFVPIALIAAFRKVRLLTTDLSLVTHALSLSPNCQLDPSATLVRPLSLPSAPTPPPRTSLTLLSIPPSVGLDEVQSLFTPDCPAPPLSIHTEGEEWVVVMGGEEECRETALWLTNQSLRGQLVRCRVRGAGGAGGAGYQAVAGYMGHNPYATGVSVYQHMGDGMEQWGGGGYNPYTQDRGYRGGGFPSNGGIDIHIPLPQSKASAAVKKSKVTTPVVPALGGLGEEGGVGLSSGVGVVGEASAPGAGKKSKKKQKKRAAAAAAALTAATTPTLSPSASASAIPSTSEGAAASTAVTVSPISPAASMVSSSSGSSIPLIAPSSYSASAVVQRVSVSAPVTPTPPVKSPASFPPSPLPQPLLPPPPPPPPPPLRSSPTPPSTSNTKPPLLLNYASHVGSLSAAEVARVAAAAKAVRDAKLHKGDKGENKTEPQDRIQKEEKEVEVPTHPIEGVGVKEGGGEGVTGSRGVQGREGVWVKKESGMGGSSASPSWRKGIGSTGE